MNKAAYSMDNGAMRVRKETADTLIKNNLKVSFTETENPVNPRDNRQCTVIGIDMPIIGEDAFNSYDDFAEQFFQNAGLDINKLYYTGVKRHKGSIVTTDPMEPWSISQSIGICYISESDVLDMFFKTGKGMKVGHFGGDLQMIAIDAMENEIALYDAYKRNDIHDVTVSTMDGTKSHTIKSVYALPSLTGNLSNNGAYTGLKSLIDDAVIEARDALLALQGVALESQMPNMDICLWVQNNSFTDGAALIKYMNDELAERFGFTFSITNCKFDPSRDEATLTVTQNIPPFKDIYAHAGSVILDGMRHISQQMSGFDDINTWDIVDTLMESKPFSEWNAVLKFSFLDAAFTRIPLLDITSVNVLEKD